MNRAWFATIALVLVAPACRREQPAESRGADRELRLVFASRPATLDPQMHQEDLTRMVLANFYECLVTFDATLGIRPRLAIEWTNPSDTVWRFRLREGVFFHDGSRFGFEDIRRTIERARKLTGSTVEPDVRSIVAVRDLGNSTIELVTDRPRPLLLAKLAVTAILPRSTADTPIVEPIGTGPYRFRRSADELRDVSGLRFDRYWGEPPSFPSFRILVRESDAERWATAEEGADFINPLDASAGDQPRGMVVLKHPTVTVSFLVCRLTPLSNGAESPFKDRRIRQALSLAIDRRGLVDNATPGDAVPAWQLVAPGISGYRTSGNSTNGPDLPRARALLAEAGLPKGLRSTLISSRRGERVGLEIARQAAAVGIVLDVVPMEWGEIYRRLKAGEAPLTLASWTFGTGDASSLYEPVLHSAGGPSGFGDENTTGYSNPDVDRAIAAAAIEMRAVARGQLLEEVTAHVLEDLPLIPLYSPLWNYGIRNGLTFAPRLDLVVTAADVRVSR